MEHDLLEAYSSVDSPIHRLDPRLKLVATLAFILAVVTTPPGYWSGFVLYFALIVTLVLFSRLPPVHVAKRSLVIFPFVLMTAIFIPFLPRGEIAGSYNIWLWQVSVTYGGLTILWNVLVKAWLSVLCLILLSSTTRLPDLLLGMEKLKMPKIMVMILSFMYRYLFVLIEELLRLRRARDSRNFGGKRSWQMKTIGNMLGSLFLRSYERAERVYQAMLSRGFEGRMTVGTHLRLQPADVYFGISFLLAVGFIRLSPIL